jgi:sigma-E factor negative regulatory protein RseA
MKERISALMDGECDAKEQSSGLESLHAPGEALETWRTYHLIRDAMSDTRLTSRGFAARVAEQLEREPTVLAPRAIPTPASPERGRWMPLYAAAGLAAAALVGSVVLAPQPASEMPLVATAPVKPVPAAVVPAAHQLTNAENDYLLAHQAYSPRNTFQGVAPYVRTVAERGTGRSR